MQGTCTPKQVHTKDTASHAETTENRPVCRVAVELILQRLRHGLRPDEARVARLLFWMCRHTYKHVGWMVNNCSSATLWRPLHPMPHAPIDQPPPPSTHSNSHTRPTHPPRVSRIDLDHQRGMRRRQHQAAPNAAPVPPLLPVAQAPAVGVEVVHHLLCVCWLDWLRGGRVTEKGIGGGKECLSDLPKRLELGHFRRELPQHARQSPRSLHSPCSSSCPHRPAATALRRRRGLRLFHVREACHGTAQA